MMCDVVLAPKPLISGYGDQEEGVGLAIVDQVAKKLQIIVDVLQDIGEKDQAGLLPLLT